MGQKQSYSLNDYKNKSAAQNEVAQTFNTAEPTPVSLKPVASVKMCDNNKEVLVCSDTNLTPTQNLQPSPAPEISTMIPLDELHVDPELPHSILVLDKENINAPIEHDVKLEKEDAHFTQPTGILLRQTELDDCNEKLIIERDENKEEDVAIELDNNNEESTTTVEPIVVHKLEYCDDELIEQEISLLVDLQPEPTEEPSTSIVESVLAEQVIDPLIEHNLCRTSEFDEH